MTNHPTAKKAKRAKSKRPAKVRGVRAWALFAVATACDDGRWYPWADTFASHRKSVEDKYVKTYGDPVWNQKDCRIVRFYVSTSPLPKARPRNGK